MSFILNGLFLFLCVFFYFLLFERLQFGSCSFPAKGFDGLLQYFFKLLEFHFILYFQGFVIIGSQACDIWVRWFFSNLIFFYYFLLYFIILFVCLFRFDVFVFDCRFGFIFFDILKVKDIWAPESFSQIFEALPVQSIKTLCNFMINFQLHDRMSTLNSQIWVTKLIRFAVCWYLVWASMLGRSPYFEMCFSCWYPDSFII